MSRSVLLGAAAVAMLIGVCVVGFALDDPGVMLLAVIPIALLGMMYGIRGGLAGAAVTSTVFLVWLFTRGQPSAIKVIEEPLVFFVLGLVTGIYAAGALGDCDPRHAIQRAGLRRAIRSGEVVFDYQPLADVGTRRVVGLEALARWEHPIRGRIEPAGFIPLAEGDERTIWELTLLALDRALADLLTWGEAAADLTMWINLSSVSLERRDLAAEFSRPLGRARSAGVPAGDRDHRDRPGRDSPAGGARAGFAQTAWSDDRGRRLRHRPLVD
jgi:hypothetical protein